MIDPQIFHPILCSMKTAPAYKSACVYEKTNTVYQTHAFDYEHCWLCYMYFQVAFGKRKQQERKNNHMGYLLIKVMS